MSHLPNVSKVSKKDPPQDRLAQQSPETRHSTLPTKMVLLNIQKSPQPENIKHVGGERFFWDDPQYFFELELVEDDTGCKCFWATGTHTNSQSQSKSNWWPQPWQRRVHWSKFRMVHFLQVFECVFHICQNSLLMLCLFPGAQKSSWRLDACSIFCGKVRKLQSTCAESSHTYLLDLNPQCPTVHC